MSLLQIAAVLVFLFCEIGLANNLRSQRSLPTRSEKLRLLVKGSMVLMLCIPLAAFAEHIPLGLNVVLIFAVVIPGAWLIHRSDRA